MRHLQTLTESCIKTAVQPYLRHVAQHEVLRQNKNQCIQWQAAPFVKQTWSGRREYDVPDERLAIRRCVVSDAFLMAEDGL